MTNTNAKNSAQKTTQINTKNYVSKRILNLQESQTLAFDKKAKEMKRQGKDVISLSAGEPDFQTPLNIREFSKKAIDEGYTKYTDTSGILELRKAICEKLKQDNNLIYQPDEIIVSCGAKHSIYNLCMSTLNPGDEVIIPSPYWVSYAEQVKLAGAIPIFVEGKNEKNEKGENEGRKGAFRITRKDIEKSLTKKTKMIFINSPCNPTGVVLTKEELQGIADLAVEKNLLVMSDEIYEKLLYKNTQTSNPNSKNQIKNPIEHISIASLRDKIKNLTITINGVSKSHSMTGWRIGYAAGPKQIISAMSKLQGQMTSNPSSISQMAALEALTGNQDSVEQMRREFEKRRDFVSSKLNSIKGISCQIPDGAFYCFADISKLKKYSNNSLKFAEDLLENSLVAVVPGSAFGKEGFIRISYATSMQNLKNAMDRIEKFILENI